MLAGGENDENAVVDDAVLREISNNQLGVTHAELCTALNKDPQARIIDRALQRLKRRCTIELRGRPRRWHLVSTRPA